MIKEDIQIWQRFVEGDKAAFEYLVQTYYTALFDYGMKFTSDREMVKDHIHDLFTTLWDRRKHLSQVDQIKPYLLKSIRNRLFKSYRRAEVLLDIDNYQEQVFQDDTMEMQIISEESVIERERKITFILSQLTRRQREIIHLKFYEDLSNEEIADILLISRGAVANLLYQTLKLVKEKWKVSLFGILFYFLFSW
ncbi:RNA polymerase sigma factor [Dyadobacter sp. CY312]|uniref:RNA polymerase sigma factor n=1 Tax=Dyadobacter sp. CY312 TaxID=2907303 RepID=UPI001F283DA5|nr:sigma-70 family RNA polymerase sigma factor [Dyadobacter sp. CY312]MCE7044343.1 sigma-70 family RNA polymerase sigma factor [Dyadobacter sp. CY312]